MTIVTKMTTHDNNPEGDTKMTATQQWGGNDDPDYSAKTTAMR
jgi:hypothetical protein